MTAPDQSQKTTASRQNIRKWLLVISFILIPVTIFYISPIILMMGASEGTATGSLFVYSLLFLVSLVVARLWCGWLCPMGAWQEICSPVMKHTVQDGWRNYLKYGVLLFMLGMLGYTFAAAGGIRVIDPFYGTVNGISISSVEVLVIVALIFATIFVVAYLTGRRGFCRVVCPIAVIMIAGRKIRNLVGWPALGLNADASRCIDCSRCSKECPMGLDVNGMVKRGDMETPECIDCASCADICPKGAITFGMKNR